VASPREFAPGFRLYARDIAVIAAGAAAALGVSSLEPWWGIMVAFVVGHFFLFCNIVRMARPLELAWAALFLALAVPTLLLGTPGWPATAAVSLAMTAVVVALQMRRPSYHGLGWSRINPGLRRWWESQA
jgi:FtsH-binding integral membrane protein